MRSFALWYSTKTKNQDINKEITVNINLWDKLIQKEKRYCFDIGFLLEDIKDIQDVYLYVPFKVTVDQVKDLGKVISNNKLINAIFNENFTTTTVNIAKHYKVNGNKNKPPFYIYSLNVEGQIQLENDPNMPGTILKIKIEGIKTYQIARYYFRIRLQGNKEKVEFINDSIEGISLFNDQFTNTEIIDFRLNDIRSFSEELKEKFYKGEKFSILAVHYLILRKSSDVIINYGKEVNSRILEDDLWNDYMEGTKHNMIAYHIKSKARKRLNGVEKSETIQYIEDFSDLTRFQYKKNAIPITLLCAIIVIFLSIVSNWISSLLRF